ncbi:MAG: NTP transferase domain-containing protein [Tissierellia bacterium]|nr:NTP transferase domain-containing protein [Tissierellia bacterium]
MNKKKIVCIVQARMGSERLPSKVMKDIDGKPMVQRVLERISKAKYIDEVVLATSINKENNLMADFIQKKGFPVFRGSEDDVMSRYLEAAKEHKADIIIRVTGDCPLIDPVISDNIISYYLMNNYDYVNLNVPNTMIRGFDTEVFSLDVLERAYTEAKKENNPKSFEHVTYFIYTHPKLFKLSTVRGEEIYHKPYRLCVDTKEDFEVISIIYDHFKGKNFSSKDIISFLDSNPEIANINSEIKQRI